MALSYIDILDELGTASKEMIFDGLEIGTVAHINSKTKPIGMYFSEIFECECVEIPSVSRKGANHDLANLLNSIYSYLPEPVLKTISKSYKKLYYSSQRVLPDISLEDKFSNSDLPILLVDDNSLTGNTFEMWKDKIINETNREIKTFSITVTGEYKPDYFCYDHWCSFEWRPIGI